MDAHPQGGGKPRPYYTRRGPADSCIALRVGGHKDPRLYGILGWPHGLMLITCFLKRGQTC
jgi:hypothetical protein